MPICPHGSLGRNEVTTVARRHARDEHRVGVHGMRSNRATDRLPGRGRRGRDESPRRGVLSAALIGAVLVSALPALAVHQMSTEEDIAALPAPPGTSLEEAQEPPRNRQCTTIPAACY